MLLAIVTTFCITTLVLMALLKTSLQRLAIDTPNQRSLHSSATPRTGGLAIMAGVVTIWMLTTNFLLWNILILALILISLADDIRGLSIKWRFIIQVLVSIFFIVGYISWPWWLVPIGLIALVWMINLFNFMDGSDGLAGGMALFGFTTYAIAAGLKHELELIVMSASIASASLAFLRFNFYPASIFMGDGGSIPLGFLAASIGLYGWHTEVWSIWLPVLTFSPFIVDATATLFKRLFKREKIWEAHRSHYYQRLVQMGWGHRYTALAEYCLMFLVSASALLGIYYGHAQWLLIWILVYLVIMWKIDQRWRIFLGKMA